MPVTTETAKVYRGGGRRFFTLRAAIEAEAIQRIKAKHPTERPSPNSDGYPDEPGWYWRELPRSEVLFRRMCRVIRKTSILETS